MANFTKKAIKEAFIELLTERPLNRITVKDIVEKCGINRSSFYYHYQDIPSLIEEITMDEANRIISAYPTIDSIEMAFSAALDFAEKHRRAILHIYNSVNRDIFEQYLWKVCDYVVITYWKMLFAGKNISAEDQKVITKFYSAQIFGLVIDWLRNGTKDDYRKMLKRLGELHKEIIEEAIYTKLIKE